jgi:hypothetical protein
MALQGSLAVESSTQGAVIEVAIPMSAEGTR